MLVYIWTRDDGITDQDFFDGDVFLIFDDTHVPGAQEEKSWLIAKVPDYPFKDELVSSEYAQGPGIDPVIRRQRKYRVDWRPKFTPEEVIVIEDATQTLGVVEGKFNVSDITRK